MKDLYILSNVCADLKTLKLKRDRLILKAVETETHKYIALVTGLSVSRIKAIVMKERKE